MANLRALSFGLILCLLQGILHVNTVKKGKENDTVRFIVMGDWGGLPDFPYRTPIEKAVGRQMGKLAETLDIQFVLALGDNFYFDGVKDVEDPRFQETFEDIFTSKSLMVDWYVVAGNHDHNGNVTAQIEYSKNSKRWNYPDFYYKLQFKVPGSDSVIDMLMIDTIVLCGNSDDDRLGKQPSCPKSVADAEQQWTWIEKNLQSSKAEYLIVAGHFPVLSIAEHGPTHCLTDRLMPMLYKYEATAYFCGHEHNIQHLQYRLPPYNTTVDYYVSGAADFIDPSEAHRKNVPQGSLKFHWANFFSLGAFGYVEADSHVMNFTFVEANGKQLYQNHMRPRKVKRS